MTRREKSEKVRAAGKIEGGKEGNEVGGNGNEGGNKRRGKGRE